MVLVEWERLKFVWRGLRNKEVESWVEIVGKDNIFKDFYYKII